MLKGKTALITGASRGIGKGIAESFAKQGCNIAFTFASSVEKAKAFEQELSSQYGIKAIQFSAIDYLLKPIDTDELTAAYERVVEHRKFSSPFEKIKLLLENIQLFNNNNPFARIALPTMEGLKFIFATDIVRCMSTNNYTYIFLNNGEKILVSKTLKEMENMLSTPAFCRVHNSHLINLKYVSKLLKGDSNVIIMSDNAEVEVSRRKKDELIKTLNL